MPAIIDAHQQFWDDGTCHILAINLNRRLLPTRRFVFFAEVFFSGIAPLIL